jgi:hypothetical protein
VVSVVKRWQAVSREVTSRVGGGLVLGLACVVALGACSTGSTGASQGPAEVPDGSFRLLATSSDQEPDPAATLQIAGDTVVLTQGSDTDTGALGQAVEGDYVLCPPGGRGSPRPLDTPVEIGGVRLTSPAVFGDCGQTKPVRVTLVDLAATSDTAFPFNRWAEFCDTKDPDC